MDGSRLPLLIIKSCNNFNKVIILVIRLICFLVLRDFLMPDELKVTEVAEHVFDLGGQ